MRAVKGSLTTPYQRGEERIRRPSLGLMARPGKSIAKQSEGRVGKKYLPVGGRVRKLRAVEKINQPQSLERKRASFEGSFVASLDGRAETSAGSILRER